MGLVDRALEIRDAARWALTHEEKMGSLALGHTAHSQDEHMAVILGRLFRTEIESSELYACSAAIGDLVWGAASTLPPFPLNEWLLPATSIFVVLEKGAPYDLHNPDVPTQLIGASAAFLETLGDDDVPTRGLHIMPFVESRGVVVPAGSVVWQEGKPLDVNIDEVVARAEPTSAALETIPKIAPFVAAFLLFINQRLFASNYERPSRAWRRRAEQAGQPEPEVNVIRLRKKTYPVAGGHHEVEWACQWMVRGHWRQQWLPSLRAHQPRWIAPYWKGPEDKPVRAPKATVFAVVQ